eukprot:CAMPEP_0119119424 /NCGR_PEP_ID=MMETSP1310-20130426/925_1 /TAXON_ID=464262 /ORGANISM="Genus nov. species nov., Strain RCC2339" /LENGTH=347 /DNA_ID=CAMNT_0007108863 /DNA_START=172 /DNA_END=1215 /DNA_ORIENTATION=+
MEDEDFGDGDFRDEEDSGAGQVGGPGMEGGAEGGEESVGEAAVKEAMTDRRAKVEEVFRRVKTEFEEEEYVTKVVLLGTGTPVPDPRRMGPCTAVTVGRKSYIVDVGPGCVRRAEEAYYMGCQALDAKRLDRLFITHLHSDHTTGLPDIIFTPWVVGRRTKLEVYGPKGTSHLVNKIVEAYQFDIDHRTCGLEQLHPGGGGAVPHEIETGTIYEDEHVKVDAIPVNHGDGWETFSYKFTSPTRTVVVSGDTGVNAPEVYEQWKGCDVLVHEVYCDTMFKRRPPHWQTYHKNMHTSGRELGKIAKEIQCKTLVLTHLLFFGGTPEQIVAEIREEFDGEVICGKDLGVY